MAIGGWANMTSIQKRFWAIMVIALSVGPFLQWQAATEFEPLIVVTFTLAGMVAMSWFAEACDVQGWWARLAVLLVGAGTSASLLPWSAPLAAWLVLLAYLSVAIGNPHPGLEEETSGASAGTNSSESESVLAAEEEDDPNLVASLVRRRADGVEMIEGLVEANDAGPTHVVFHPPLNAVPDVELHALDDCDARVAEKTPYGIRVMTSGPGRVAFTASAPAA